MNRLTALLAPILLVSWTSLYAHHSTASFFFLDRRISVEGTVVEFHARNPHGLIVLDAVNDAGETERWRAEMPAWQALLRWLGWSPDDLQPGDRIVIHGAPPRMNESFSIRADDVVMPDGWTRHLFRDPVTDKYRKPTPPARAIAELDGVWELNRGWTDHPDDNPDTYERTDFRPYTLPEVLAAWQARDPLDDPKLDCEPPTVSEAMSGIHADFHRPGRASMSSCSPKHSTSSAPCTWMVGPTPGTMRRAPARDIRWEGMRTTRWSWKPRTLPPDGVSGGRASPQRSTRSRGTLSCHRGRPVAGAGGHNSGSAGADPASDFRAASAQGGDAGIGAVRLHAPEYGPR